MHSPDGSAALLSWSWCDNRWSPTLRHASKQAEPLRVAVLLEAGELLASYAEGSHGDGVAKKNPAIADGVIVLSGDG